MFFTLDYDTDKKVIGSEYPQIQKMSQGYDFKASESVYKLSKYRDDIPLFDPNLKGFILEKKAKPTDLISCVYTAPNGYIISKNLKDLLKNFKLPEHKIYNIELKHNDNKLEGYYWLQIINIEINMIDYVKSTFMIYKDYCEDLGSISITSKNDYISKVNKVKSDNPGQTITIWAKNLKFNTNINLDFFKIGTFNSETFISKKFQSLLVNSNLTGFTIKPAVIFE